MDGPGNHSGRALAKRGCEGAGFYQSACSISPPDVPCYRAEADAIAAAFEREQGLREHARRELGEWAAMTLVRSPRAPTT
jgi:hypothetical protein